MESALASTPRVIECPSDLAGCSSLAIEGRKLMYACSQRENETSPFVVVLGFFCGQKEDVVTKDLIEPVSEFNKRQVSEALFREMGVQYSKVRVYFL